MNDGMRNENLWVGKASLTLPLILAASPSERPARVGRNPLESAERRLPCGCSEQGWSRPERSNSGAFQAPALAASSSCPPRQPPPLPGTDRFLAAKGPIQLSPLQAEMPPARQDQEARASRAPPPAGPPGFTQRSKQEPGASSAFPALQEVPSLDAPGSDSSPG